MSRRNSMCRLDKPPENMCLLCLKNRNFSKILIFCSGCFRYFLTIFPAQYDKAHRLMSFFYCPKNVDYETNKLLKATI